MPGRATVLRWLRDHEEFRAQYEMARMEQADVLADEIIEIADQSPGHTEHGTDSGAVQHQRLRVDARKWVASKLKPKVYGDKQAIEHSGGFKLEQLLASSSSPNQPPTDG